MRIDRTATNALQADGKITDERDDAVGHREFTGKPSDCEALARAVGVWASLVLDAEVHRPRIASAAGDEPAEGTDRRVKSHSDSVQQSPSVPMERDPFPDPTWPPPDETPSRSDEASSVELGIGAFVMSGIGGGDALVGATSFLFINAYKAFFFRPAFAAGGSLEGPSTRWAALRLDGCFRVIGQNTSPRDLQIGVCAGTDVGTLDVSRLELTYVAPGPSLDLQGELGSNVSVMLRGIAGINAAHDNRVNTPLLAGRGELALSWRLQ